MVADSKPSACVPAIESAVGRQVANCSSKSGNILIAALV